MKAKTFILSFLMMFCSFAFGQHQSYWGEPSNQLGEEMVVITQVVIDGELQGNNIELGAFCGNELRGSAFPDATDNNIIYIVVKGEDDGDKITYKLYDHNQGKVLDFVKENALTFEADARKGSISGINNGLLKEEYRTEFTSVAETNGVNYGTFQGAIDACVEGDNTIKLLANISDDVTVNETAGVNIEIQGNKKEYSGTINIVGNSTYGDETLSISNVKFVTSEKNHDFIWSDSQNAPGRYCNNVSVDKCYFVATDEAKNTAVGLRIRQGKNIDVTRSVFEGMHSAMQMNGTLDIYAVGLEIKDSKNGISASGQNTLVVDDSKIFVEGYGVRTDGKDNSDASITGTTITANLPVVVRKTTGDYNLNVEGGSLTAVASGVNTKAYQVIMTAGDDDEKFVIPSSEATATITGDVKTYGLEAKAGDVCYARFEDALEAAKTNGTDITILQYVLRNTEVTYDLGADKGVQITTGKYVSTTAFLFDANATVKNADFYSENVYAFFVDSNAKLVIEDGIYHAATTVAQVTKGSLEILGGEFSVEPAEAQYGGDCRYLLNCKNGSVPGVRTISVKGGKFYDFDPENNLAEGAGTNFCAEGYISEYLGNNIYTVNNGLLGEGTAENPFRIRNLKELTFFRNHVNAGETKYNADGVYVALEADIDMASVDWSVNIGDNCNNTFDGIFDGKNHTIFNLNSKETVKVSDGYICTGLFGAIAGNAVIKNLTIENVDIEAEFAGNNIAAVVGFVWTGTGSIENVTVTGDVNIDAPNAYGVGAIVGYSYSSNNFTVKNCTVNGAKIKAISGAGAIIGYCGNSDIESCKVEDVTIEATGLVGGVAGVALAQTVAKDNTVKNVTLTTTKAEWVNSAAVVVGTMAGNGLTVSNTTIDNVNATSIVGSVYAEKPTTVVPAVEARIGDKYYGTFAAAYTAAQAGETITLLQNISSSEIVTLDKAIILDGNGKTLTSTAGRAINVDCVGDVNISNLTITTTNNTERAINVINKAANLTLNKVTAEGFKYTINVASSSVGSTINTIGGKFSGYAAVNITANNTTFNSNDTEFVGINNEASHESNTYAVIAVNAAPTENVKVNINGGKVVAQTNVNKQFIAIVKDAKNANITINAELELADDNVLNATIENGLVVKFNAAYANQLKAEDWVVSEPTDNLVTVLGRPVAAIGETKYHTLASAVSAATAGQTIEIIADLNENVTIEKKVTINGNGFNSTGLISTATTNTTYTFKNFNIEGSNNYFVKANGGHGNIVIENCTVKNSQGLLYVNKSTNNVIVKNVNVENCYYGARIITVNNANFENVNISGTKYGIEIQNQANRNVTFKNCEIAAETPVYVNPKGTGTITFYFKEINDLGIEKLNFGEYAKVVADAMVGTKIYEKFDAALAANGTVKVINPIVITENKEYDFTSETIVGEVYPIIRVQGDATLTIKGTGSITNEKDYVFVLGASDGTSTGNLIIKNGTYKGSTTLASVTKGNLVIEGGEFSINPYEGTNYSYLINCVDANYKNGDATVAISGGRFYNWNPQDNAAEGEHTNFCAQGYAAKEVEENVYEVVEAVAAIGNKSYASIQDAIDAAQNDETVVLLQNVTLADKDIFTAGGLKVMINVEGKDITLDLNEKTIELDYNGSSYSDLMTVVLVADGASLTVEGNGTINFEENSRNCGYLFFKRGDNGHLTINNGSFRIYDPEDSMIYTHDGNDVTINGGNFVVDLTGTRANGCPWIFNTRGSNETGVTVMGGTFNADINHQYWAFEVKVSEKLALRSNSDGTWTVVPAEAYVVEKSGRKVGYVTLTEAFAVAMNNNYTNVVLVDDIATEASYKINKGETIVLDLNGKTITGTDIATGSFGLFTNQGDLTIKGEGTITLKATNNRAWNAYSSVISNTVGGKLTVNGGTIEHLGGTDMAYGIDNLTNGKGTYAETVVNGGTVKSTYRAIRQFLNGVEAQNILTVNGGTIEGTNKSIWMQDPSANANSGKLTVGKDAKLIGDAYLTVTAGSTEWPVEVAIAAEALQGESKVRTSNVPATYAVEKIEEIWTVVRVNTQSLVSGWNWFSHYVEGSVLDQLKGQLLENGISIKTMGAFINNNGTWVGNLTSTSVEKMYKINVNAQTDVTVSGKIADPSEHTIALGTKWNWIGYPLNVPMSLNEAYANVAQDGDYIKTNGAFAEYSADDQSWHGNLRSLTPGIGYMYFNAETDATDVFTYSYPQSKASVEANITAENNYWVPTSQYANNMTMVAMLDVKGDNYEVAAFVNGEVRGSARPIYIESLDAYMFFLTIHGENVEEMTFKCYDIDADTEYTLSNVMNYSNDAMVGSLKNPYLLSRGTLGLEELSSFNIYPNPTTTDREINLSTTCDKVEVFNALGVKVAEYQNVDTIDAFETAGIYVIRVTNNGNVKPCRLVVK